MMRFLRVALMCSLAAGMAFGQGSSGGAGGEWHYYGHDSGDARFSPLKQINRSNVQLLQRAWTYQVKNSANSGIESIETTPLMVDGVLYFTTPQSRAIALDGDTGKELWVYDPFAGEGSMRRPMPNRGMAYWEGTSPLSCAGETNKPDRRLLYATLDGRLRALNPDNGQPCKGFGEDGSIDLRAGIADKFPKGRYEPTSPPVIYKDLVIMGGGLQEIPSKGPAGDVRAYDVHTGKLVWTFHTVPRPGETGHDTWQDNDWVDRSGVNAWSIMSVDAQRGIVFLPLGSPSYDFYGGDRKGQDLFGNSLVALDAATGKLKWYFQMVHHDLWDYDVSGAPSLVTIRKDGKEIPAVAEITKMGFLYLFNRVTGQPIYPIEERPVQKSDVPGEQAWPTQPFPIPSLQLAKTEVTRDEITTVTPESRQYCLDNFGSALPAGIFLPWRLDKLTLEMPGSLGGGNWSGVSFNPSLDYVFVNIDEVGAVGMMTPGRPSQHEPYVRTSPWGGYARLWDNHHYPCQQPPWGDLNAVDLKTGKVAWKVPLGVVDELTAKGVPKTGIYGLGGSIATAGDLVFIAATHDQRFRAFDAKTGAELWVTRLESNGHATPMTYLGRKSRKQFVVIAVGPGGYFNTDMTAPTVLAAYALYPKGETSPAALAMQTRTISPGPGREPEDLEAPGRPIPQPVAFSHQTHVQTVGLPCETCHASVGDGAKLAMPDVAACMNCHQTIKTDNPEIQHLAHLQQAHVELSWTRLYKLPDFVFFSHQKHLAAKVDCAVCHGPVRDQAVLWQERSISMVSCVDCHKLRGAPVTCDTCHNIGH